LQAKLARAGFVRAPHEPPYAYLDRVKVARPDLARRAAPLIEQYVGIRYGPGRAGGADVDAFAKAVRRFAL
jgi:hypothetical protein